MQKIGYKPILDTWLECKCEHFHWLPWTPFLRHTPPPQKKNNKKTQTLRVNKALELM